MPATVKEDLQVLGDALVKQENSMKERYDALKKLRAAGGYDAFLQISRCLRDPSVLLSHECAFTLGQIQVPEALPVLKELLCDESLHSVLRHEAIVGLGTIGSNQQDVMDALQTYAKSDLPEIAETCDVALGRLEWLYDGRAQTEPPPPNSYPYHTDAAPAYNTLDVDALRSVLVDDERSVFDRYRAMYQLRNIGTVEAVNALIEGFKSRSVVLRHEIGFIFGQVGSEQPIEPMRERIADLTEHGMVRHECCEGLAAIGSERAFEILREFSNDKEEVVRDSCVAALGFNHVCLCLSK